MKRWILAVFLFALYPHSTAIAQAPQPCATPRAAVDSVFVWQQPGHTNLQAASRCLPQNGRSSEGRRALAEQIKAVFDANGWRIRSEELPEDPDYREELTGDASVLAHPNARGITVVKNVNGQWLWSAAGLDRVRDLYASLAGPWETLASKLPGPFHNRLFGVQLWKYVALLILCLCGLLLRKVIAFIVEKQLRELAARLGQAWAARVVNVVASPGATLVMAFVLRLLYPQLRLPVQAALILSSAVRIAIVMSIVWAAYRLVDLLAESLAHRAATTDSKLDDQLVPLLRKALKIVVVLAGGLFVLQNLDVDVGSLLAGLGIGGIAVALAAKDTLANFFGSVMIFLDRPFQIGDWVRIEGTEGVIEEVGFRSTRIRTFYNSLVTIPNAKFTESEIDNLGRREYRRCFVTLNLTYDTTPDQMQAFVEGVRAIIAANPKTRKDYYEVHMSAFGAHSLDVMVYFFFKVETWSEELQERHRIFLEIMRLAKDLDVSFAFPTQTLHMDYVHPAGAARSLPTPMPSDELADVVTAFGPGGTRGRPQGPHITHGFLAGTRKGGNDGDN